MGPIAIDDVNAYWIESGSDGPVLRSMSKCGGAVTTLVDAGSYGATAYDIVARDGYVYWASTPNGLGRIATSGGTPQYFQAPRFDLTFDVDDTTMYALDESMGAPNFVALPMDGAPPLVLAQSSGGAFFRVRVDCATAFFTIGGDYQIQVAAVPKTGGPSRTLPSMAPDGNGSGLSGPIAMDNDALYWVSLNGDALLRIKKDGSSTQTLATRVSTVVAVDDDYAYVTMTTEGGLERVPKLGGVPSVVASDVRANGIAVDEGAVYWSLDDSVENKGISITKIDK